MQVVGSKKTQSTKSVKSSLKKFVKFVVSSSMFAWLFYTLSKLSLTVFESNDTIGLSLLGGLIMLAYILVRKELHRW